MKFIYWVSLITSVQCVFLNEAFSKNWVHYNHGELKQWEMINDHELLALTRDDIIKYSMDDDDLTLMWKINVPSNDFIINGDQVFTFSIGQSVSVWDKSTGILQKTFKIKPVQYYKAFDGVIILDEAGTLSYIDTVVVEVLDGISDIKVSEYNGFIYVITNGKLFKIDSSLEIQSSTININFNKIIDFKYNLVKVGDAIYNIDDNKVIQKAKDLQIIHANFTYSFDNDQFKVFKNGEPVLTDEFKYTNVKYLENQFILSSEHERKLLNFGKFWHTNIESDIILESYNFTNVNTKDYLFNNQLVSVGIYDKTIEKIIYDFPTDSVTKHTYELSNYDFKDNLAILINKPESKHSIDLHQHLIDEINGNNFIVRWYKRIQRHLTEFGKLVVSKFINIDTSILEIENKFGLEKYLVFIDNEDIIAIDSLTGEAVWKKFLEPGVVNLMEFRNDIVLIYNNKIITLSTRDGEINGFVDVPKYDKIFKLYQDNEVLLVAKIGNDLKNLLSDKLINHQNLIQKENNIVKNYKVENNKLTNNWQFSKGEIITVTSKPFNAHTSSLGITLHDKSVLYKYLNDTISVITKENDNLRLYILSEQGSILYSQIHNEKIDYNSVNLIMDDNWIIYSYFSLDPYEQRIVVIDLFNKDNGLEISTKSFIYPEPIVSLSSTSTNFGITIKSIIAITEDGDIIELPKYILNSRRIDDHIITPNDMKDDFRMMPYEPIIPRNNYQVLNHQFKLDGKSKILLKDTNLESTLIIVGINNNQIFCSYLQPSLSFDKLGENFSKFKLIITVIVVLILYLVTKPMLTKKKLNSKWIYSI